MVRVLWMIAVAILAVACSVASGSSVVVRNHSGSDLVAITRSSNGVQARLLPDGIAMVAFVKAPATQGRITILRAPDCASLGEVPLEPNLIEVEVTDTGTIHVDGGPPDELSDLVLAPPTDLCDTIN